jgi:hypothetical protein
VVSAFERSVPSTLAAAFIGVGAALVTVLGAAVVRGGAYDVAFAKAPGR